MKASLVAQRQQPLPTCIEILQVDEGHLPFKHPGGEGSPPVIGPLGVILVETLFQKVPQFFDGGGLLCVVGGLGNSCIDDPF